MVVMLFVPPFLNTGSFYRFRAKTNDQSQTSLTINCTCTNGTAPGLQYYINTVPTFLCEELHTECKTNNAGNANAQKACDQAEQANCGKQDPSKYTPPSSSSTSATSGSASATATNAAASSGTAAASSTSKAAAPTMAISRELGTGIFAAGAAAAFGLII